MSVGKVGGAGNNECGGGVGSDSGADSGSMKSRYQSSLISCFSSMLLMTS